MAEWISWITVAAMGVLLGLVGGGGGIITVPILTGMFAMSPTIASGSSLLVVGSASAFGAAKAVHSREVDLQRLIPFAVPAVAGGFLARKLFVPSLPATLLGISTSRLLMLVFGLLMVGIAIQTFLPKKQLEAQVASRTTLAISGFLIGFVSATLGAGGGFLILPALVRLLGIEMKDAVPSSLAVIAFQSLGAFLGDIRPQTPWLTLLPIVAVSLIGMAIGVGFRPRIPAQNLRVAFGVLISLVALWVLAKVAMNRF